MKKKYDKDFVPFPFPFEKKQKKNSWYRLPDKGEHLKRAE